MYGLSWYGNARPSPKRVARTPLDLHLDLGGPGFPRRKEPRRLEQKRVIRFTATVRARNPWTLNHVVDYCTYIDTIVDPD